MSELRYRISRHLNFTKKELTYLFIALLAMTFIYGYNDGSDTFVAANWLANLLKVFIMMTITFIIHELGHKIAALWRGFHSEFKPWTLGMIVGLIVTILTAGGIPLLFPGRVEMKINTLNRLGHFRYGRNISDAAFVAISGPLANLIFATIFKTIALLGIVPGFFDALTFLNLYYAVFSMIPLHMTDGVHLFYATRNWYVIVFASLVGYIILYAFEIYSLILAIVIGLIVWFIYYISFEESIW